MQNNLFFKRVLSASGVPLATLCLLAGCGTTTTSTPGGTISADSKFAGACEQTACSSEIGKCVGGCQTWLNCVGSCDQTDSTCLSKCVQGLTDQATTMQVGAVTSCVYNAHLKCLSGSDASSGDGGADGTDGTLATPIVDLVVDANRDGVADLKNADDQAHSNEWTSEFGASYLANLDDDDGDKIEDVLDTSINGADDELDLAPITIAAWPDAPDGYVGVLSIDNPEKVRLWKNGANGWEIVAGVNNDCVPTFAFCPDSAPDDCADTNAKAGILTADDLRKGVKLAIEGRDFRRDDSWNGNVRITYWIGQGTDAKAKPIPTKELVDGKKSVLLHVAPWILNGNLTPFDEVRAANYFTPFVPDLKAALGANGANVKFTTYANGSSGGKWNDAWTQDYYQTAWTSIPQGKDADGKTKIHGMRVANARPWGRYNACSPKLLPIAWLRSSYLGKDKAAIAIYLSPNSGSSYDSHGNHDLLPAYSNNQDKFPVGRIIHGSGILDETSQFYNAQGPQSPALEVDTSWLLVGHVDEVLSYSPAKTDRGWKLLVASNNLAKQMLQKLADDGHGAALLFDGKNTYKNETDSTMVPAAKSVTETLNNSDLLQWSQEAHAAADGIRKTVVDATGLTDAEIIEMPFLTEEVGGGKIAWQPGTANMLLVGNTMEIPNPFGPKVNGVDVFAQDLKDRLGTPVNALGADGQGMKVFFIDDFESYHINEGEVHCGTNPEGPPQPTWQWWLVKH